MRVLLICGDYYHPEQIFIDGIAPLSKLGFQFDIITNANGFSPEKLNKYPAVILSKPDEISEDDRNPWKTENVQKAFVDYVESGGGLIALHSGVVGGKNTETLDKLLGCRFITHPNNCPVTVQPLKKHPVTEGVGMFCEIDEHYKIEIIAPDVDILAASYSGPQGEKSKYLEDPFFNAPAAICAAGYVRTQGKGRVCVLTPGHLPPVWENPHFQKLLENAILWITCG